MKFKHLLIEQRGPVRWIVLNRPEVKNAFNLELGQELGHAVREALQDRKTAVVVLSGQGEVFSAGGDIKGMAQLKTSAQRKRFFLTISGLVHATILQIRQTPKPVLAAAPGYVGGVAFGLFLATDLRLASPNCHLSAATIHLGLVANGGATFFLPRLVGLGRATELLFTGEKLAAPAALQMGLLQRVVPSEQLHETTQQLAEQLAASPRQALGRLKQTLNKSGHRQLVTQLKKERKAIAWSATTADFTEGVQAFLEKRRPRFQC